MIGFTEVKEKDTQIFKPYLEFHKYKFCDYSCASILMWKDFFSTQYALIDDCLVFKFVNINGSSTFTFPLAKDEAGYRKRFEVLEKMRELLKNEDGSLALGNVSELEIPFLKERYANLELSSDRDWADYLYTYEDLLELKGRKFSAKRNQIHNFDKTYEGAKIVPVTEENVDELIAFYDAYYEKNRDKYEKGTVVENEATMVKRALKNLDDYNMFGASLKVGEDIVAFSLAERLGDVLFIHVEKADIEYKGCYQKINQEFLKYCDSFLTGIQYVNREEDVGDLGLRKAKMSYQPVEMLEKYAVVIRK